MINIDFNQFDTSFYSYRHNIIELIKAVVGFSIEINIVGSNVENIQGTVDSMQGTLDGLNENIGSVDLQGLRDAVGENRRAIINLTDTVIPDIQNKIEEINKELSRHESLLTWYGDRLDTLEK